MEPSKETTSIICVTAKDNFRGIMDRSMLDSGAKAKNMVTVFGSIKMEKVILANGDLEKFREKGGSS
jgi:hypothetical protein